MIISVIGCGYLGAVHAACMAKLGHSVIAVDVDAAKIASLSAGNAPFYEPGFDDLLSEVMPTGRLTFTTKIESVSRATVHFIAVGTPQAQADGSADLSYVHAAVNSLAPHLTPGDTVVGKSTVPVGTAESLAYQLSETEATLIWNPEFLREGFAIQDTLTPDRIVYGLPSNGQEAARAPLDQVYAEALGRGTPVIATDYATAELVKVAANAFLATKISFINAMSTVCDAADANVVDLADAIGLDDRIGRKFLGAGLGFGGGCLPKDIRAFQARGQQLGVGDSLAFLGQVDAINQGQRTKVIDLTEKMLGTDLTGKRITLLGLAFKPNSDDVRDSPAIDVAGRLMELGADLVAFDPAAGQTATARVPSLTVEEDIEQALSGAELVILATEWQQFRDLDPERVRGLVATANIIDARNALSPSSWKSAGWNYLGMGTR